MRSYGRAVNYRCQHEFRAGSLATAFCTTVVEYSLKSRSDVPAVDSFFRSGMAKRRFSTVLLCRPDGDLRWLPVWTSDQPVPQR